MKIAIITSGLQPLPATKGGAVANLVENIMRVNEIEQELDITTFCAYEEAAVMAAEKYKYTHCSFFKIPTIFNRLDDVIYYFFKYVLRKKHLISYRSIARRLYMLYTYTRKINPDDYDKIILLTNPALFLLFKNKTFFKKAAHKTFYYLHNEVRSMLHCEKEFSHIEGLISISEFVQNSMITKYPFLKNQKCRVVKNCIDTKRFENVDSALVEKYRKKYGINKDDFVILFTGRLDAQKGILETVKALNLIKDDINFKLLIVGNSFYTSDFVSDYEMKLRDEASSLGNRIIMTGYVDYDEMPAIYKLGTIAVLPSMWEEPAGLTMIEAVVSGLPLITTKSGGIQEYIPNGASIVLERDENIVNNIASSIISLHDDIGRREYMKIEAKKILESQNLDIFYREFVDSLR